MQPCSVIVCYTYQCVHYNYIVYVHLQLSLLAKEDEIERDFELQVRMFGCYNNYVSDNRRSLIVHQAYEVLDYSITSLL